MQKVNEITGDFEGAPKPSNVEIRILKRQNGRYVSDKKRSESEWANADLNRGPPGYQPSAQPD
jgi:hypothetical protein